MLDLICISHLRWDFVWQRPQHLLSRMAQRGRVLFVEEPIASADVDQPKLEVRHEPSNVTVVRLLQPMEQPCWLGHGDPISTQNYTTLLNEYLVAEGYTQPVLWLYTPMAWEFTKTISHQLLIYDVMDELSAFKGAPAKLREREKLILNKADLVFTGGLSLYESKRADNRNTHLFPSGVEISHFAQAAAPHAFTRPVDLMDIRQRILGYFGVIDERMDLHLLAHLAQTQPDCSIVMLGPVVKISPQELPQAPNLHYLGMKRYQELPHYLAFFDVALIPFALNDATRYLSPTKTLEYMAARKPIVSTAIRDVGALYGDVVRIGNTAEEFSAHINEALTEDHAALRAAEDRLLAKHTWDNIAQQMQQLIVQQLAPSFTPQKRAVRRPLAEVIRGS
jgi:UDP-galactopyranose mutase